MGNSGTALGIIAIILAAGVGGFAFFVWNGQNTTNSDLDDLQEQLDNMTPPTNTTGGPDLTNEFNNLTNEFNNLTNEFNNLTSEFNNLVSILNNVTRPIVVGIWDELDRNMDYTPHNLQNDWLIELGDNKLFSTEHLSLSNSYTRISLLEVGWYRIHLSLMVTDLAAAKNYRIHLYKDDEYESSFDYFELSAGNDIDFYVIHSSVFVNSDGTNYIELNGYCSTDNFITSYQNYNQLTIEYVSV